MENRNPDQRTHEEVLTERLKQARYKEHEISDAIDAWAVTKTLLPKGFDDIAVSKECSFCIGEKHETHRYAQIMLAHEEPLSYKRGFLGIGKKVQSSIGSLISVFVPVCKRCKRVFRMISVLKWMAMAAGALIGLGAGELLRLFGVLGTNSVLPVTVMLIGFSGIGYFLGKLFANAYVRKKEKEVHLDIFDIDILNEMKTNGWFLLQDDSTSSSLVFKKKPDDFGRVF